MPKEMKITAELRNNILNDYLNKMEVKDIMEKYKISKGIFYRRILSTTQERILGKKSKTWKKLVNTKINKLTVLEEIYDNSQSGEKLTYRCLCECGKETIVRRSHIVNGRNKSCGCLSNRGKKRNLWEEYGEVPRILWRQIKRGSESRYLEFNISSEYIWNLFLGQNRKCALSGIELKFNKRNETKTGTASLDRIDSKKGYIIGNVQWIHKDLNKMKLDYDNEYFINMCHLISENNKNKISH